MVERYVVETTSAKIPTRHTRKDEEGEEVGIATASWNSIKLVDTHGVWPSADFTDVQFAQMAADALNKMQEEK